MIERPKPLILVVDDDRKVLDYFENLLQEKGYRVILSQSGEAALTQVKNYSPDLVLLDIIMPGLNGFEVCRILKAHKNNNFLPVIILTAKNDLDSRVEGLRMGADDYLSKPADPRELLARIEALLRIKELQDRMASSLKKVQDHTITDSVTGLYNGHYLEKRLYDEFKRAERYSEPLSCIMLHVEDYEKLLEEKGRDVAQQLLKELAEIIRKKIREFDIVVRRDEAEFVVLLPRTHFTGSLSVASRIWRRIHSHTFMFMDSRRQISVSMGVSFFPNKDVSSAKALIDQASHALYKAREAGSNQICLYQHTTYFYRPDMGR